MFLKQPFLLLMALLYIPKLFPEQNKSDLCLKLLILHPNIVELIIMLIIVLYKT